MKFSTGKSICEEWRLKNIIVCNNAVSLWKDKFFTLQYITTADVLKAFFQSAAAAF